MIRMMAFRLLLVFQSPSPFRNITISSMLYGYGFEVGAFLGAGVEPESQPSPSFNISALCLIVPCLSVAAAIAALSFSVIPDSSRKASL